MKWKDENEKHTSAKRPNDIKPNSIKWNEECFGELCTAHLNAKWILNTQMLMNKFKIKLKTKKTHFFFIVMTAKIIPQKCVLAHHLL